MLCVYIIVALLADKLFGEVSRGHPLVAFGKMANAAEVYLRRLAQRQLPNGADNTAIQSRLWWAGAVGWTVLVAAPSFILAGFLSVLGDLSATLLGVAVLYFCIGMRSLEEHARAIARPLLEGDIESARENLGRIVSRDTLHLDAHAVTGATIESVLENGSDAVLAPIFWFALAGAPGVLAYRLANTLDAMWGYRTAQYLYFGKTAARMDDVLNWLPARCCALAYALAGNRTQALRCWGTQAEMWDSPNAGPVMAAGAGALNIRLGGAATYHGQRHWRPDMGAGDRVQTSDIERALALVWRAVGIWLLVILLWSILL